MALIKEDARVKPTGYTFLHGKKIDGGYALVEGNGQVNTSNSKPSNSASTAKDIGSSIARTKKTTNAASTATPAATTTAAAKKSSSVVPSMVGDPYDATFEYWKDAAADAKGSLVEKTDTSERDAYLAMLSLQLQQQQAMYDQMDAMYRQQYEAQQRQLAAEREAAKRNAYINNQVALKNLPTELAADGINGGLAESSRVRLHTAMNRNMAGADYLYDQDVANAYQNMLNNKAGVAQNRANASLNYSTAAAKAPAAKKVTVDTGDFEKFVKAMSAMGYKDEQILNEWNNR